MSEPINAKELNRIHKLVGQLERLYADYTSDPSARATNALQTVRAELLCAASHWTPTQLADRRKKLRDVRLSRARWEAQRKKDAAKYRRRAGK